MFAATLLGVERLNREAPRVDPRWLANMVIYWRFVNMMVFANCEHAGREYVGCEADSSAVRALSVRNHACRHHVG